MEEEIKRLPAGVAMIVSNDIERPVLVDVRIRKSKHGGESVDVIKERVLEGEEEGAAVGSGVSVGVNEELVAGGDGDSIPAAGFSDMTGRDEPVVPDGARDDIAPSPPVVDTGADAASSGHKGTFAKLFGASKKVEEREDDRGGEEDIHEHVVKRVPRIVKEPVVDKAKDKKSEKEPRKKKKQEPEAAGSLFKKVFGTSKK